MDYNKLPDKEVLDHTIASLKENNFNVFLAKNREDAKNQVLQLLKEDSDVMTMTSVTLDTIGIPEEVNKSGKYKSVREKLMNMDDKTEALDKKKIGSTPHIVLGSVHAVTQDGKILIASKTGSQLPAYAFGAQHVIWVVGTQKIVKDISDGINRIYTYTLAHESERVKSAYGIDHSDVNRILIMAREDEPRRSTIIFINENIGF